MKKLLLILASVLAFASFSHAQISQAQILQWSETKPIGNPPFNYVYMYFDPTTGNLTCINSSGSTTPCSSGGGSFTAGGDLSGTSSSQTVIGIDNVPLCAGFTPTNGQVIQYTTGGSPNPCYTAGTGGAVSNQVKGQPAVGSTTASTVTSSPFYNSVAVWCGDGTGATCPGFASESLALNAIETFYNCGVASGVSCNIIDDLTGTQYWTTQPINNTFTGRVDIKANGPAHLILVDGISTVAIPSETQIHGMGGTGSDQQAENTTIAMCNPLTDNCPAGGFVTQNTSATTVGLSVSGSLMTVTLGAGAPFSTSSTAINQLVAGRRICIVGASSAADNGCFTVASITSATAPQIFVLNIDSASQVTCASPCGSAVATLNTPLISIGSGGGGGAFHARLGDVILDCHLKSGGEALVNGQGEEGTGTDGVLQVYNCPEAGVVLEQSGIYGGNGTIGTTNGGTYANIAINFNPYIVTNPAGAPCSNNGTGGCSGGVVPAGTAITCGAGTTGFAVITPKSCQNPNWVAFLAEGTNGNQGTGEIQRLTISCQDKSNTGSCIFSSVGAGQPTGIQVLGQHISFGDTHTEFVKNGAIICGDPAVSATWAAPYAGLVLTSGVALRNGFWSWQVGSGIGIDIGGSGNGSTCQDIEIAGINLGNGSGTVIKDNISGITITGSASEQVETYTLGHGGGQPSVVSTAPSVGVQAQKVAVLGATSGSCPLTATATGGTLNICSTNATVTSAGLGTFAGGVVAGSGPGQVSLPPGSPLTPVSGDWNLIAPATITAAGSTGGNTVQEVKPLTAQAGVWQSTYSAGTLTDSISTTLPAGLTGYLENNLTGASAAGTITEGGATFSVTRAGIATANLTAPWVFQNTNSSNNNTSITAIFSSPGTSTGQTTVNINGAATGGNLLEAGTGGTVTAGVLSGQTKVFQVSTGGAVSLGTAPTVTTPGTGLYMFGTEGTEPSSIGANTSGFVMDSTSHCPIVWRNAANGGCTVTANGVNTAGTGMTINMAAATTANAFVAPVGAGLTSGTNGAIAYDTTAGNTHIRTNATDTLAVAEAAALAANIIPKATDATHSLLSASSITDDAKNITTSEVFLGGNKVFLNADFTDSTSTTLQLITGLSYTLPTSKAANVSFHCVLLFDQGTAAVSDQFGIGVTGTAPTQANASATVYTSTTVFVTGTLTALASTTPTAVVTFTPSAITTIWKAELDGTIEQPSNATPGVFSLYAQTTTGSDNLIVKRGSYCTLF